MVGAVESGSGGNGFDSRQVRVTFGIDFWSSRGDFFMALGMCGEWSGGVSREGRWRGGRKMSGSIFPTSGASK